MAKAKLHIAWATHKAAKYACENWHYSKSVPVPPIVKIGVWEDDSFIGVVLFSRGASSNLLKPYGLEQDKGCELTRIALDIHSTSVTKIVKLALKFLRTSNPELRLVVSFADPQYGHHGGIYQGGNWVYVGDTATSKEFWKNGKRLHSRQISSKGFNIQQGQIRKTFKPSECRIKKTLGKHRYLMPLDNEMLEQIKPLSKPYPKRDKQAMADSNQHSGGVAPTVTLQINELEHDATT